MDIILGVGLGALVVCYWLKSKELKALQKLYSANKVAFLYYMQQTYEGYDNNEDNDRCISYFAQKEGLITEESKVLIGICLKNRDREMKQYIAEREATDKRVVAWADNNIKEFFDITTTTEDKGVEQKKIDALHDRIATDVVEKRI